MFKKCLAVGIICLLMLVIPTVSATETDYDVEFHIYSGNGNNVGIGVTCQATNTGEEPVNVTFIFFPICFRPWTQMVIDRVVQPHDTVIETFYFPVFSFGMVLTAATEQEISDNNIERMGFHYGQLVFLGPVM